MKRAIDVGVLLVGVANGIYGTYLLLSGDFGGLYLVIFGLLLVVGSARALRRRAPVAPASSEFTWTPTGERIALIGAVGFLLGGFVLVWLGVDALRSGETTDALIGVIGGLSGVLIGGLGTVGIILARRRRHRATT